MPATSDKFVTLCEEGDFVDLTPQEADALVAENLIYYEGSRLVAHIALDRTMDECVAYLEYFKAGAH